MYRKVSDGGESFGVTKGTLYQTPSDAPEIQPGNVPSNQLQSFVSCPQCGSEVYSPCNCYPLNYGCTKCDWLYVSHRHGDSSLKKKRPTSLLHPYTLPN